MSVKKTEVILRLSAPLSERIGSRGEFMVEGDNIKECLKVASIKFPDLEKIIWSKNEQLNSAIVIFYREEVIKENDLMRSILNGDQIDIIPAISGG